MRGAAAAAYGHRVTQDTLRHTAVIRGIFRGFAVLFVGGTVQPLVGQLSTTLAYAWLPLVAVVAFAAAAVVATPPETPTAGWRQGPLAAVGSYLLILPLVRLGAGELPVLQLANGTRDLYDNRLDPASRQRILAPEQLTETSAMLNQVSRSTSTQLPGLL